MEYIIKGREPKSVFNFFEEISAIPRGSGNEKGIADYLEQFAISRGLEYSRDEINNVFIKKPASAGRETSPAVLFQGHTDMVCEKNAGTDHDFLHDGIKLYVDGNLLRAKGTTLGADDGVAVAMMLALLDGAVESHPDIECLFTVSEETGMDGVNGFDFSQVKARQLINLDSAEIDTVVVGCAGGVRCNLTINGSKEANSDKALKITVCGLAGGHSGENINDGRANANKLIGRILLALKDTDYRLVALNGGGKSNAIPRECYAVITTAKIDEAKACAERVANEIAAEISDYDRNFAVHCETVEAPAFVFDKKTTGSVVTLLGTVDNGVFEMSKKIDGFVEFSRNLGVISTIDNKIVFAFLARSERYAQLEASNRELEALSELYGADIEYLESYHGWSFDGYTPLLKSYADAYRKTTGEEVQIKPIHAGLECGIIKSIIPDIDIISIGPNEYDIHSPDEALDLDSVTTLFEAVKLVLLG